MRKKSSRTYTVFFEAAPEGGYVATVPILPGCHTQGETMEEAEQNAAEAIELYIESLKAHGEAVPEEHKSFQGSVTVPV
jgi:antitoxin HicB